MKEKHSGGRDYPVGERKLNNRIKKESKLTDEDRNQDCAREAGGANAPSVFG